MKIYLGSDHAGFELKEAIKRHLLDKGYEVKDFGAFKYDKKDDYPDFVRPVAVAVVKDKKVRGIVLGGSGQGEAMVCNRYKGARAVVYYGYDKKIITLSREHNDANILSLGGFFLKKKEVLEAVDLWLKTKFSGAARHKRRIGKIEV